MKTAPNKKYFTKYSHTDQFRQIVNGLTMHFRYAGKNDNGEPIYDFEKSLPTIKFIGTNKIHGSNVGIGFSNDMWWTQSRNKLLSAGDDHRSFYKFVEENIDIFNHFFNQIKSDGIKRSLSESEHVMIYGEWFGEGIQNGVAVSHLPRSLAIFEAVIINHDTNERIYIPRELFKTLSSHDHRIYNIFDFGNYEIEVNLNNPQAIIDKLNELTTSVGNECPVGKYFDISGPGEGIVWRTDINGIVIRFKTKTEKFAASKAKEVKIAPENFEEMKKFIDYSVTENRLKQGLELVCGELQPKPSDIGNFIKWVIEDINREEKDTIEQNGFDTRSLNKLIQQSARKYILDRI